MPQYVKKNGYKMVIFSGKFTTEILSEECIGVGREGEWKVPVTSTLKLC